MKKNKTQTILSIIFALILFTPHSSLAFGDFLQSTSSSNKNQYVSEIRTQLQENQAELQQTLENFRNSLAEDRLQMLKEYAIKLIDVRLQDLTKAQEILGNTLRLSEENRDEIVTNMQTSYDGLVALKASIESATDLASLKDLIRNIFYDYRVYIVELPKDRGLRAVGWAEYVLSENEAKVITRIEIAIEEYKNAGKDTTVVEGLVDNLQAKFQEIQGYLDSAKSNFRAMEPAEDTTESEAYLEAGKQDLQKAKQEVQEAKDIIQDIIAELKSLKEN